MTSEIIPNLETFENNRRQSRTIRSFEASGEGLPDDRWVTLVFPNYSKRPVEQKWSKETLSVIPYFSKLFSFPSPESAKVNRIVLEWDPKAFVEIIDSIRCEEKTHIEAFSEFLGLEIEKKKPKEIKQRGVDKGLLFKEIFNRDTLFHDVDVTLLNKYRKIRMIKCSTNLPLTPLRKYCEIVLNDIVHCWKSAIELRNTLNILFENGDTLHSFTIRFREQKAFVLDGRNRDIELSMIIDV